MTSEGKLTISKWSYDDESCMGITIEDTSSGLIIAKGTVTMEDFMEALTGLSCVHIDLEVVPDEYRTERFGKNRETRRILLDWEPPDYKSDDGLMEAIEPHLIDGWAVHDRGLKSQQNIHNKHQVILIRYVKK